MADADGETKPRRAAGLGLMTVEERTVEVAGQACRVWEKGRGKRLGFLAGLGGLLRWPPFLDRLAATRRVVVPSLPGFPGAGRGHDGLDSHLDWILATRDLLSAAGLEGADLIGASVGGALAAEVAAIWPAMVGQLVLVAPLGIFDEADPILDVWAQRPGDIAGVLCANAECHAAATELPEGEDLAEWQILQIRANEAAARILWPLSDTKVVRRLGRIEAETLVLWGQRDRVAGPGYADRFATAIGANARVREIAGAGHLATIDAPDEVARAVEEFLG